MKLYARKRMRKLANYLRTAVRPKQFNMYTWYDIDECGTSGCMMGYACLIPSFKKAGLKLVKRHQYQSDEQAIEFMPEFKGEIMIGAAMLLFDISESEALALFNPDGTKTTPKQGAAHLERFLKRKEKEQTSCA